MKWSDSDLEDDLDTLIEEAIDQKDGTVEGHHRQKECEEPGQADGRDDSQLLHVFIQQGEEGSGQLLKHPLIHQSACRDRNHITLRLCPPCGCISWVSVPKRPPLSL